MKRTLCRVFSAVSLLGLPALVGAAETSVDSTTILRIEQSDNGSQKDTLLPATEFLSLDATRLADGNLSFHFYGWGRADLAEKSFVDTGRTAGSLTYGYLQYRFKQANADIRLGRQLIHDGINNEQIDGLSMHSDLPYGFGISAFGGANVHTRHVNGENSDGKGDGIAGGRLNYRLGGMLELGVSGVYESKAPTLIQHTAGNHRLIGGDVWFSPHKVLEVLGHTTYNTETSHVAEHSYLVNLKPMQRLVVSGEFNEQNDRSYQYAWAMFSGNALNNSPNGPLLNSADTSRNYGGRASYQIAKLVELSGDYKHYRRAIGNANRYGGDLKMGFIENMLRAGASYHYLDASPNFAIPSVPTGSYHEMRAWGMYDSKSFLAAVDFIDYLFKERISNEKQAWEVVGSLGYHLTPQLFLSGDISYGRNPYFTEETRGLVRLTYNTTFSTAGGKK